MSQIQGGETFTNIVPGKTLTSDRLNNHVNGGVLLNGAVIDQTEKTLPVAADTLLLGDSTLASGAAPKKVQVQNLLLENQRYGTQQYQGTDTGAANTYVVALSPAATAYTAGMVVRFKAGNANTGASTIAVNGLGAKTIKDRSGADLAANAIVAGQVVEVVYDGTYFQMATAAAPVATLTAAMAVENFRTGENQYAAGAGAANAHTVTLTPAITALTAGLVVRFKAGYTNTGAATLAVNGFSASIKRIVAGAAVELAANDIQVNDLVTVVYDGTQFQITGKVRSWDTSARAMPYRLLPQHWQRHMGWEQCLPRCVWCW